ncbi:hypothetical protein IHE55_26170 [Streptomyces pactum]|uniref:DUF3828 domain-containing protein n=1 Tax=Streptomyces pactum TaxID=68249 RepID=A0ABS0NSA8_9ACTN|nr:hypothetical protein [Streptomyces pactum]
MLALALTAAAPAAAHQETRAAGESVPTRSGSPDSAVDRVADFYGTYIDVVQDRGRGDLTDGLREHYLTEKLRTELDAWERDHRADGVLRSREVPSSWRVTYDESAMGHTWTTVRLSWGDADQQRHTYLTVRSDLATKRISGIETGPAPADG